MSRETFRKHFVIGEPIAFKTSRGSGTSGLLVDLDDHGIYIDQADGGVTFLAWSVTTYIWNGPPAQKSMERRAAVQAQLETVEEGPLGALLSGLLGRDAADTKPALSEDEIAAIMDTSEPDA